MPKSQVSAKEFFERGYLKHEIGDLDGAIADYTEAIRLDPEFAQAYDERGIVRLNKHEFDLDAAFEDFSAAIGVNPHYCSAWMNRGYVYRVQGKLDRAIHDYTEAVRVDPNEPYAYFCRAAIFENQLEFENAINDLERFKQIHLQKYGEEAPDVDSWIESLKQRLGR